MSKKSDLHTVMRPYHIIRKHVIKAEDKKDYTELQNDYLIFCELVMLITYKNCQKTQCTSGMITDRN